MKKYKIQIRKYTKEINTMTDMTMNMINDAALEEIVGGATRKVKNTSTGYAYVRAQPGLKSRILGKVSNGRMVTTTNKKVSKDGYVWYEIRIKGGTGWIAGSLIGY